LSRTTGEAHDPAIQRLSEIGGPAGGKFEHNLDAQRFAFVTGARLRAKGKKLSVRASRRGLSSDAGLMVILRASWPSRRHGIDIGIRGWRLGSNRVHDEAPVHRIGRDGVTVGGRRREGRHVELTGVRSRTLQLPSVFAKSEMLAAAGLHRPVAVEQGSVRCGLWRAPGIGVKVALITGRWRMRHEENRIRIHVRLENTRFFRRRDGKPRLRWRGV